MASGRRNEEYELRCLLWQIDEEGFVVIHRDRLLRLLGKGNESPGTWTALLDEWEAIEGERDELFILKLPGSRFLLTGATSKIVGS